MQEESLKKQKKKKLSIKERITLLKNIIITIFKQIAFFSRFLLLLFFAFWAYILQISPKRKLDKPKRKRRINIDFIRKGYTKFYNKLLSKLDSNKPNEVKDSDLIFLALKNLSAKKSRTYMTIGGMAIGFGAVILLLSAGYGFERLVVSQVASLSEMKQVEVSTSQGSPLSFNTEVMQQINDIEGVETIVPVITSVSKVTYNNAVSDVIGYGVTSRYFQEANLSPVKGELFTEETPVLDSHVDQEETKGYVAGAKSTIISSKSSGQEISQIRYAIYPLEWKPVYEQPNTKSKILGYTKREMGKQEATEVWGTKYEDLNQTEEYKDIEGTQYSKWIKSSFPVWRKEKCPMKDPSCVEGKYMIEKFGETQKVEYGYITENDVTIERYEIKDGSALEVYTGKVVEDITFKLNTNDYTTIYMDATQTASRISTLEEIGNQTYTGKVIYGGYYDTQDNNFVLSSSGGKYSYWVKTDLTIYSADTCTEICDKYYTSPTEEANNPLNITLYIKAIDVNINNSEEENIFGQVLGATDVLGENDQFVEIEALIEEGAGEDDEIDWVAISEELGTTEKIDKDIKTFPENAQKLAVVNLTMLNLLGIDASEAIGEQFDTNFIYDSKLFDKTNYLVESEIGTFTIVGVVSDSKTPAFYVPFNDIRVEGIKNVSQIKVILDEKDDVTDVRATIESLGFQTSSVVDTVDSISELFHTLRIALLVLGLIALGVASLGMFNTLTVSLLEKTREVGLLKTMGLKSDEVKTLFLAESIIMSITGGLAGLLLGFLVGKLISILISVLALSQGQGVLDVTYIPTMLGVSLVLLAAVVGVITGWYPAQRATKVSALNALRYE